MSSAVKGPWSDPRRMLTWTFTARSLYGHLRQCFTFHSGGSQVRLELQGSSDRELEMTTYDTGTGTSRETGARRPSRPVARRTYTETKEAFKTTEFWAYIAAVVAIIITAVVQDNEDGSAFGAEKSLLYITILTAAYAIGRGLAKSGSREPYTEHEDY
jgi:hypothetical protein